MAFLSQRDIALEVRAKAEKEYKAQLRAALLVPGLSPEMRRDIKHKLGLVGHGPRVYDAASPPLPGAIDLDNLDTQPKSKYTLAHLQALPKRELVSLALNEGFTGKGVRAALIEQLLSL